MGVKRGFFEEKTYTANSHGSSVSIVTRLWVGGLGFDSQKDLLIFHHHIQTGSVAHTASYPMGTRDSFPTDTAARV
jgi:hypothetical protein